MLKIALTGGIGSGKTTVAHLFAEHGVAIIDTDNIAREVVKPDTAAWQTIIEHFGQTILLPDHQINRTLLREKIFTDPAERYWLEALLHPLIRKKMLQDIEQVHTAYCLVVIPLLTKTSHAGLFDRILVVIASEAVQIQRIMARDQISEAQARAILAAQITDDERLAFADDVLENTGDVSDLANQVNKLHQCYLLLASNC